MGKVGSTTVFESLKVAQLPFPTYQIHFLARESIAEVADLYLSRGHSIPGHLRISKALRRKLDRKVDITWRVITLVRDPIARASSDIFQNVVEFHPDLLDEHGVIQADRAIIRLEEIFLGFDESTNYVCTWFDKELKRTFNVDVFDYPFDTDAGYAIIKRNNIHVLIIRLENLDQVLSGALEHFMGVQHSPIIARANVRAQTSHADMYTKVRNKIVLPRSACVRVYSSRFARHFYSQAELDSFISKWSSSRDG
jgi:hypothetical protein